MRPILLSIGCLALLFPSCDHSDEQALCSSIIEEAREDTSVGKPICIVLCDFSSSLDSGSKTYVRQQALQILDRFYNKAIIRYYPISNASIKPMFESGMKTVDSSVVTGMQNSELYECLKQRFNVYRDSLDHALTHASRTQPRATYIIQSLENAINIIRQVDHQQKNRNVIFILSDMLESGSSSFGNINLDDRRYDEDISTVDSAKIYSTSVIGATTDIKVCFYTQNMTSLDRLTYFWNLVFHKLGYSKNVVLSSEAGL